MWREDYTPFGEARQQPAANDNGESYTGHIADTDTGLIYMQARYYDPAIGRFLSSDPVGFASGGPAYFNRYAYVGNNPLNATDTTGECANLCTGGIGAGIGAIVNGGAYAWKANREGNFTWTGFGANVVEGGAVGFAIGSGAGLLTIAATGALSNVGERAATSYADGTAGERYGFDGSAPDSFGEAIDTAQTVAGDALVGGSVSLLGAGAGRVLTSAAPGGRSILSETLGPLARGGLKNSGAMANSPVGQAAIAEGLVNTLNPAAVEALRSVGAEQIVDLEDQ